MCLLDRNPGNHEGVHGVRDENVDGWEHPKRRSTFVFGMKSSYLHISESSSKPVSESEWSREF
jgi:hypothetical protein